MEGLDDFGIQNIDLNSTPTKINVNRSQDEEDGFADYDFLKNSREQQSRQQDNSKENQAPVDSTNPYNNIQQNNTSQRNQNKHSFGPKDKQNDQFSLAEGDDMIKARDDDD